MLTLSQTQLAELSARDAHSFVAAVCDQYLTTHPDKVAAPGRDAVVGVNYLGRSASIILAGEAKCC